MRLHYLLLVCAASLLARTNAVSAAAKSVQTTTVTNDVPIARALADAFSKTGGYKSLRTSKKYEADSQEERAFMDMLRSPPLSYVDRLRKAGLIDDTVRDRFKTYSDEAAAIALRLPVPLKSAKDQLAILEKSGKIDKKELANFKHHFSPDALMTFLKP